MKYYLGPIIPTFGRILRKLRNNYIPVLFRLLTVKKNIVVKSIHSTLRLESKIKIEYILYTHAT